jgi:16S rRNA processing protein RimM
MEYLRLGTVVRPFGLDGVLRIRSLTSFPEERFSLGAEMTLLDETSGKRIPVTVKSLRVDGDTLFVGFEEIKSVEEAEAVRGYFVEMDKSKAPLPKGYYRYSDLVGCKVVDDEGHPLGEVTEIMTNCPTPNLRVRRDVGKDFFVPFVMDEFVKDIDIEKKTITVNVVEGML